MVLAAFRNLARPVAMRVTNAWYSMLAGAVKLEDHMCRIALILGLLASTAAQASSQQRGPEYLEVANHTKEPIAVFIRSVKNPQWAAPATVKAGTVGRIRLREYQPFEIAIRRADNSFVLMHGVTLCTMMDKCKTDGPKIWNIPAQIGRWVTDDSGGQRFVVQTANALELKAKTAANSVRIDFGTIAGGIGSGENEYDPPRKPKIPKRRKDEDNAK